ncbi:unnamed protein product [Aspergillus oryzae]|uniref:Unnamed protein product n=2 Tax=Aspergillus oryzae TaxID=5062 RepID=A0AAN5C508_ASPOZ|nr:unnamed protein product [Aspergillus oryzae]GMF87702.1 unnamed protein product [Aspergillus oryzae]GMG09489.1 unnamed protein product [Aspergillus oryzae]GMG37958.1 unnamed protein product [Aspergillus oryzae]GMG46537.1 unnamed protein product [Aspergillus oryzae var. brunneus]
MPSVYIRRRYIVLHFRNIEDLEEALAVGHLFENLGQSTLLDTTHQLSRLLMKSKKSVMPVIISPKIYSGHLWKKSSGTNMRDLIGDTTLLSEGKDDLLLNPAVAQIASVEGSDDQDS